MPSPPWASTRLTTEQRILPLPVRLITLVRRYISGAKCSNTLFFQYFNCCQTSEVTGILTTMPGMASRRRFALPPSPARRGSLSEQTECPHHNRFLQTRQHFPYGLLAGSDMLGLVVTPAIGNMRARRSTSRR